MYIYTYRINTYLYIMLNKAYIHVVHTWAIIFKKKHFTELPLK